MQSVALQEQRKYIYENIETIKEHKYIIDLLDKYEISYTENSNGIFVNLNIIPESIIQEIYSWVFNVTETNDDFSLNPDLSIDINQYLPEINTSPIISNEATEHAIQKDIILRDIKNFEESFSLTTTETNIINDSQRYKII